MSAARRWLKQLLCRHIDLEIGFHVDHRVPGWWFYCNKCEKRGPVD